jgi:hypothetical protein
MLHLLRKWHPENDPLTREQAECLLSMLDGVLTEKVMEGFLIVCSRFVDEFGGHRTMELSRIFKTETSEGKASLRKSLEHVTDWTGGMDAYERDYPVTVYPSNPAFPQLKVIGIGDLAQELYRVMNSTATVYDSDEPVKSYILRTGALPAVPVQRLPVLREKPVYHWCSYEKWGTPNLTQGALQILPKWNNDCRLRVTLETAKVANSSYVAFNGDMYDPGDKSRRFYKYFFEPLAQDHLELAGGGSQIGVDGAPPVARLEEWNESTAEWSVLSPAS